MKIAKLLYCYIAPLFHCAVKLFGTSFRIISLPIYSLLITHYSSKLAYAQEDPEPATFSDLEKLIKGYLNMALTWAIIAVFAMLLYGGFKYLTAGGDPKGNEAAKATITYAVIGLLLMIGAWFILNFIQIFTGVNITEFTLNLPE